jgi:hypothetical protein
VPSGIDEVEAAVHTIVDNVTTVKTTFVLKVLLKLAINILDDLLKTKQHAHKAINREKISSRYVYHN